MGNGHRVVVFYCQRIGDERQRKILEARYKGKLRLYPVPCSGRVEIIHLLKALEDLGDSVHVVACEKGSCRYKEGNLRSEKRVRRAQQLIKGVGLGEVRLSFRTEREGSLIPTVEKILWEMATLGPLYEHSGTIWREHDNR